jgi:predicted Zn-dependent protease
MLGSWLAAHREPDQARAAFLAAKIADPRSDLAFISLARLDAEQNQIDLARQELSQVLARNGGNVTARFLMGELEEKTGDSAGAVQQYRAAIQSDENNVVVLMSLARALVKSSANGAEALDYAQKAVKLAPHDPRTQDTLASVRNSQKLMRGAR